MPAARPAGRPSVQVQQFEGLAEANHKRNDATIQERSNRVFAKAQVGGGGGAGGEGLWECEAIREFVLRV